VSEVLGEVENGGREKGERDIGIQKTCLLPPFSLSPFFSFEKCL
jgi:hypothetical protein